MTTKPKFIAIVAQQEVVRMAHTDLVADAIRVRGSLTHYNPIVIQPVSSAVIESSDASGYYQRVTVWRQRVKDYLGIAMRD